MGARIVAIAVFGVVAGCTDEGVEKTVRDQGGVCVVPRDGVKEPFACPTVELLAGEVLRLTVDFDVCLSSSCSVDRHAACAATVEGSVITVTAEGRWRQEGNECTDDCGFLTASCEVGPLPAGDYELGYAGDSVALSLPSASSNVCTARPFGVTCCDDDVDCAEGACGDSNSCVVAP